MTLEKLLGYTAAQLNAMPKEEWQKILDPYLNITRPDRAPKPASKCTGQSSKQKADSAVAQSLLKGLGIDLDL